MERRQHEVWNPTHPPKGLDKAISKQTQPPHGTDNARRDMAATEARPRVLAFKNLIIPSDDSQRWTRSSGDVSRDAVSSGLEETNNRVAEDGEAGWRRSWATRDTGVGLVSTKRQLACTCEQQVALPKEGDEMIGG